ncbi:energy-dependent translational throttle protein EttA [Rubrivirga sp. SAORIC476]|uniref:energy-dependent translational throttle protein EttA n=1 Tax=Rubrivirga sp. SAORIC476 TaxID=1961794 RepID=UPI000BA9648A|nr:energy-dependent translational throttle protein EttA [Rubrivirga sp. SAORIC476]PAP79326.1 energy-dependent translational throttle protein EttA [Rubrivirga sp. SAORIC476]
MSDQKIIFSMLGVGKTLPTGKKILDNIYLSFYYGAKIGVLGLNGAGKSTLLRIIAGQDDKHDGEIQKQPGLTIGMLEQEPDLGDPSRTVKEVVEEGMAEAVGLLKRYEEISNAFAEPDADFDALIAEQGKVQEDIDRLGAWDVDARLQQAMDALHCPPADAPIGPLSGGEKRRVALVRLLLQAPDVLLLDEPTNHLDARSVAWLEQHLAGYEGTVIAVTHDRYFLDNVAGWILELDRGKGIPFEGNYTSWLEQKEARLKQEEKDASKRQKTIHQELEWVRQNAKGQRTKSKARIARYEELQAGLSEEKRDELEIYIPPGPRLGNVVVQAEGVKKGYGDRTLVEDLTFDLPPGGIVGIVGPNGAGKTTLFRMITGQEQPDAGSFRVGETVQLGYVNQERDLDPDKTVWQVISGGADFIQLGTKEVNSRAYVGRFNFGGADQQKKVGTLSGGERGRLQLAVTLKEGANVLLLDEPTNDLDVNTLRALEEALLAFGGCAVVISHDRWFLNRVATHILAFEEGGVFFYPGNYAEYEADRKVRLGVPDDEPTGPHRRLTRA